MTNSIVISIKSILTFMMIHIGSSGSKSNPHYGCDEQCYKCNGSSKCSKCSGSSGSTGINIDPCSIPNKNENDDIEIHLSFQPGNEYNLAGIFEWEEDNDNQLPPLIPNNDEATYQTIHSTIVINEYELNLLLEDWDEEENYMMIGDQSPTWIGIN